MPARPKLVGDKDRLIPAPLRRAVLQWLDRHERDAEWGEWVGFGIRAIRLADGAGLRRSEIVALQVRDCDLAARPYRLLIRGAKHRAADHVDEQPIGDELRAFLRERIRGLAPDRYVYGGRTTPYEGAHCWQIVKRVHRKCEVPEIYNVHSWRHGYGTRVYRETRDLVLTSRMLRHRTTSPTERYVHMAEMDAEQESLMRKLDRAARVQPARAKRRQRSR